MKKRLNISIPKSCHEDWQKMTPNQQGKFCNSCAKTVVDFTKKSVKEIQSFFIENQGKKVCGRFKQNQLDSITIEIPEQVLFQQVSFSRMFLLALLITMGATLMSCNSDGKKQKINEVIVLDSIANLKPSGEKKIDSIIKDSIIEGAKLLKQEKIIPPEIIVVTPTTGEVVLGLPVAEPEEFEKKDSIKIIEEPILFSDESSGEPVTTIPWCPEPNAPLKTEIGFELVDMPPKFKESETTNIKELKTEFKEKINAFVTSKLDLTIYNQYLTSGKYKTFSKFIIDKSGKVTDIQTRAPHVILEEKINNIIKELPQFIPGTLGNKSVPVIYILPIAFIIE